MNDADLSEFIDTAGIFLAALKTHFRSQTVLYSTVLMHISIIRNELDGLASHHQGGDHQQAAMDFLSLLSTDRMLTEAGIDLDDPVLQEAWTRVQDKAAPLLKSLADNK